MKERHATAAVARDEEEQSSRPGPLAASPTKRKPPHHAALPAMSQEERQARQMRSFLHNFLADDRGEFHHVLDLHQHAIDSGLTVTDATLQEVVNTVPQVRGLRLTGCSAITDAGLWTLARQCSALDSIFLGGCVRLTDLGLRLLAHNCRLVAVDLSDCPQLTDSMLQTLAAGCWTLESLALQRSHQVGDAGLVKIAQCCPRLRHLNVSECHRVGEFGDQALLAIGRHCAQLETLDLFGCRHVHDQGVQAIARGCPQLSTLKLTGCNGVTSAALQALAQGCPRLCELSLAGCTQTTNSDLLAFARGCPSLRWLDVSGSPRLDADGLQALATHCEALAYLNVAHCDRVDDAALLALARGRGRAMLTHVVVAGCRRVSEQGVEQLTAACPNLLTMDMTDCARIGRRFLQRLVHALVFVEWASAFFGFTPLPNAAALCQQRDRRVLEHRSAVQIQRLMRGCLARGGVALAKRKYVERKWLPRIQARVRGFLTRQALRRQAQDRARVKAATYIATQYRNFRLRRQLAHHRKLQRIRASHDAAATVFQRLYRGHRGRKIAQGRRDERARQQQLAARVLALQELAAIKVQRAFRGHVGRGDAALKRAARDAARRQQQRERLAAVTVQRVYRGHCGRQQRRARVAELRLQQQQHRGATRLQSVFRGHKGRRHARLLRDEAHELQRFHAALTIQRRWRGVKDKHLAAVLIGLVKLRAREQEAAAAIQRVYRAHASRGFMQAMKAARKLQQRRLWAAVTLQRMVRGHRGRAAAEVQRELRKLEAVAAPLFRRQQQCEASEAALRQRVEQVTASLALDEADEAALAVELAKTMQIKTKYHDSSRMTGTPQRYLTQYLQVQLADQLRGKRMELAVATRALDTLTAQWKEAQKQLRAVQRELEPLTVGVATQTKANRVKRLQTQVRRQRRAATAIQRVFRGYRVRCAVREGANCWLALADGESYYNTFSGETRTRKPLAMSLFGDRFMAPMVATVADAGQMSDWYEAVDDQVGQAYYFNATTKEYQWERPALAAAFQSDSQSARRRRQWLQEQQDDGDVEQLIAASDLRAQLGEWQHRVEPVSEHFFFYHPPSGELRASLSPRSVHETLVTISSGRRSVRSVRTASPRPTLWQYRYGYEYSSDGQLVAVPADEQQQRPIWTEQDDEASGAKYYYNHITEEYRWEKPPEFGLAFDAYAATTNSSRAWFTTTQQSARQAEESGVVPTSTRSSGRLLTDRSSKTRVLGKKWIECVDAESGHTYYYNEVSGESRWSLSPRSARDTSDEPGEISLALFEQVRRLREEPVVYSARETHMVWLEDAMDQRDWAKVDVLVQQIGIREQSQRAEEATSQLPIGWTYYQDPMTGEAYYYHAITGESSWIKPTEA